MVIMVRPLPVILGNYRIQLMAELFTISLKIM